MAVTVARTSGRHYPQGHHTDDEVQVAYAPRWATRNGYLRLGPDPDAPPIDDERGLVFGPGPGRPNGRRLGLQSELNPTCLSRPPLRQAINGMVWTYQAKGGKAGFWPLEWTVDLGPTPPGGNPLEGPADEDFEWGQSCKRRKRSRFVIGEPLKGKVRSIVREDEYARYNARGVPFFYCVKHDRVREIWRGFRGHYTLVEAERCRWIPDGTRFQISTGSML